MFPAMNSAFFRPEATDPLPTLCAHESDLLKRIGAGLPLTGGAAENQALEVLLKSGMVMLEMGEPTVSNRGLAALGFATGGL